MSKDSPILVTGAAGEVGAIGRTVTGLLLERGLRVRALVRREDERAEALRRMGAQTVVGDLLDLHAMHRAIEGCRRLYFGMSVSPDYLQATVNVAAVARHHGVDAFVNMSQMTLGQMSVMQTTDSPQHKLHWLAEQALDWSGLPVVHVRPTVFLEGFFLRFAASGIRRANQLALPMGQGRTSPIAAHDVARAVAAILAEPAAHVGQVYHLAGPQSEDLGFYAREYSAALGREIRYVDVPLAEWRDRLAGLGLPPHLVAHVAAMAALTQQGRYDRVSGDLERLTGTSGTTLREFVQRHEKAFQP